MEKNYKNKVFLENVQHIVEFMKQSDSIADCYTKAIELEEKRGFLVPMSAFMAEDYQLISKLSQWRNENAFAYPAIFKVTDEGTKRWLEEGVIKNSKRILFLIADKYGEFIGHIGYANLDTNKSEIEIDNVLRGNKKAAKGIITLALKAIIKWAEEILLPDNIYLKVLSDNSHAVDFYLKNNFVEDYRIPLKKVEAKDRTDWIITENKSDPIDKYFIKMNYVLPKLTNIDSTILTAGPSVSCIENTYTSHAAKKGWNNEWAFYLKKFESEFAKYIGVKHAIATSSCTGALHLALLALGIGPGDEVIVPDLTWVASAQVINYVGAIPVFADIDRDSWTLDPDSFKSLITKKTKAVIPVHTYGHPAEMDKICEIAKKHNLFIVEDAAPSIGAEFKGKRTGSFGHFSAFSFQGAKLVVTGEGGMLLTDDDVLYEKAYKFWDQGRKPGTFWIDQIGWKYKMTNLQAAFGLGQLERTNILIEAKRRIFSWYMEELKNCTQVKLNYEKEWARSIYWMSSIYLTDKVKITRDAFISELKKRKIDSRPTFPAISKYHFWPVAQTPKPIANDIGERSINLPSGVCLSKSHIEYISKTIIDIVNTNN